MNLASKWQFYPFGQNRPYVARIACFWNWGYEYESREWEYFCNAYKMNYTWGIIDFSGLSELGSNRGPKWGQNAWPKWKMTHSSWPNKLMHYWTKWLAKRDHWGAIKVTKKSDFIDYNSHNISRNFPKSLLST